MRLTEMRVRNYRNIATEQTLKFPSGVTLVGPNNSGKTNLLKSIQLFFTGYENSFGYRRASDLTIGAGSQQTSLVATFQFDGHERDQEIIELLDELHSIVGTTRDPDQFTINLYFTATDTPVYRVLPNTKIQVQNDRSNFSRKQKQLVENLMRIFRVHYVPSAKSITALYSDLLEPFLKTTAFDAIKPHLSAVHQTLDQVSSSLNVELASSGLSELKAAFKLDLDNPYGILSGIRLLLSDPDQTPIFDKGQGIQSTALFASFVWIAEREKSSGSIPVWLIEEPESYLHPELAKACRGLLHHLAEDSTVILTTHALTFVPTEISRVQGIEVDDTGRTAVTAFATHQQATQRIRNSLGVQFADYYNLGLTNVFVEGPSDARLIPWASGLLAKYEDGTTYPLIDGSLIVDFGGVSQLEGFLRGVFEPLIAERAMVAVFDGDTAGVKARQNLQQYLGKKGLQFQPNREFVSVRAGFAIEGLFPDSWILSMHDEHPSWFESFSLDAGGIVEPFSIRDNHKSSAINYLTAKAEDAPDSSWASRWEALLQAIEDSLARQKKELKL